MGGTWGEKGFRVACDEPLKGIAHAGALAGQNGRFPSAQLIKTASSSSFFIIQTLSYFHIYFVL
jgi:hypothetical protein